ncbi:hypothetical protein ACPFP2_21315 [Micromonospora citrea]|uniref:hypothetical protein n=1 Tax=Micromonospora citrea TaxID=47855 RepID=UPI003C5ABEBB
MSGWIRAGNGLYVPAHPTDSAPPVAGEKNEAARSTTAASWIQAVAALAATVVSSMALVIAVSALRDQQQVNSRAMDRFDRRYAERVSWWATRRDRGTVTIQNRSPVPVLDVTLMMVEVTHVDERKFSGSHQRRIGVQISDLPPCTMTVVDPSEPVMSDRVDRALRDADVIPRPHTDGGRLPEDGAVLTYAVRFHDGNALWERERSDLRQLHGSLAEEDLTIIATTQSTQPVTDCGTDG